MHVLIAFMPADPDGPLPPDPQTLGRPAPRTLWHYTTAHKLEGMLTAGAIMPATAMIQASEQPCGGVITACRETP